MMMLLLLLLLPLLLLLRPLGAWALLAHAFTRFGARACSAKPPRAYAWCSYESYL